MDDSSDDDGNQISLCDERVFFLTILTFVDSRVEQLKLLASPVKEKELLVSPVKEKENKTPPKNEKAPKNSGRRKGKTTVSRTFKDEEGYLGRLIDRIGVSHSSISIF